MNRQNLIALATYLKEFHETNLTGNQELEFSMDRFCDDAHQSMTETCGTIGCAVGHGPYAGIPKLGTETWTQYTSRVFGVASLTPAWEWMFAGIWAGIDNTPLGAAKRIWYYLEGNTIPKTFTQWAEGSTMKYKTILQTYANQQPVKE